MNPPVEALKPPNRYRTVRLSFMWQDSPAELSFELHNEYFTLTSVLGAPQKGNNKLAEALATFNQAASTRYEHVLKGERPAGSELDQAAYEALYRIIWEEFHEDIFAAGLKAVNPDALGAIFADFRGVVAMRGGESGFINLPGRDPEAIPVRSVFRNAESLPARIRSCLSCMPAKACAMSSLNIPSRASSKAAASMPRRWARARRLQKRRSRWP